MYPDRLSEEKRHYFSEEEYFQGKFNYVHTYLHKNYKYKMHSHQFYEINIITVGKGRHYIEDTVLDTSVGDVFVIPPSVKHGYYPEGELNIYHVLIKNEFFERYSEEISEIDGFDLLFNIEPQIRRASGKNFNLNAGAHLLCTFKDELERMENMQKEGRFVHLNALALAFVCRLCEKIRGLDYSEKDILDTAEYIRNNLENRLTVEELSKFSHMSSATLNRHFKAVLGVSPMKYALNCRVEKARNLVATRKYCRTAVAQMCGFYDIAHMNKYI